MNSQDTATVALDVIEQIVDMIGHASNAEAFGMGLKIGLFKFGSVLPGVLAFVITLLVILLCLALSDGR